MTQPPDNQPIWKVIEGQPFILTADQVVWRLPHEVVDKRGRTRTYSAKVVPPDRKNRVWLKGIGYHVGKLHRRLFPELQRLKAFPRVVLVPDELRGLDELVRELPMGTPPERETPEPGSHIGDRKLDTIDKKYFPLRVEAFQCRVPDCKKEADYFGDTCLGCREKRTHGEVRTSVTHPLAVGIMNEPIDRTTYYVHYKNRW
jgi:hypothetical protein